MSFQIYEASIKGIFIIQSEVFGDSRGHFLETWSKKDFSLAGIDANFVQDNQSKSVRGVLRGLHFQKQFPQGKLVRVISGEVFDVAVDLRFNSITFGKWFGIILSGTLQNQLYVPPGFAHGFFVLSDKVILTYKCTEFYHPEDEGGIKWDDPTIGINWPNSGLSPLLSEKDIKLPLFNKTKKYF